MEFTKPIQREITITRNGRSVVVVATFSESGLTFRVKGTQKAITSTWFNLLINTGKFTVADGNPKLTKTEEYLITCDPINFLLDNA